MKPAFKPLLRLLAPLLAPAALMAGPAAADDDLRVEIALETVAFARADGVEGTARLVRLGSGGNWQAEAVTIRRGPMSGRAERVEGRLTGGEWNFFDLDLLRGDLRLRLAEAVGDPAVGVYRGRGGLHMSDRRLSVTAPTGSADLRTGRVILEGGVQGEIRP